MEKFKKLKEFPNYLISNHGRILSLYKGAWLTPRATNGGQHLQVCLKEDDKMNWMYVHRLVAMAFIKRKNKKCNVVMHLDDNPKNNHIDNLKWGTQLENMNWIYRNQEFGKIKNKSETIYKLSVKIQEELDIRLMKSLDILAKKYNRTIITLYQYYKKGELTINLTQNI